MSKPLQQQMPRVQYSLTRLGGGITGQGISYAGGLDLTTPSLALQPGALRDCLNFECAQSGGYARIQGYERVDGRAAPSAATYTIVQISSFTNVPSIGQTITQATSGATGNIIAVNNVVGACYMAVTQVTGTFDFTHAIAVGITPIGTAITPTVALSRKTEAQYFAAAADVYRALIGAVPGSGAILGVVGMVFNNVDCLYAFRANVGATAVNLYQTSAGGWVQVPFFNVVEFTAGAVAIPLDGAILTQGGVTATIKRVMWRSGAWTGTAAGGFVITNPVGGNFAAGAATISGGATVTLSGIQTAITLAVGGRFEFIKCNFSGQLVTRRIYGCDGVNKCFEFDGTALAPITTGLSPDTPNHIVFFKNYLVVSQASSIIGSGPGTPFKWTTTDGGWEIATGDAVTVMLALPGSQTTATLGVFMRGNTAFLYGTNPTDFNFVTFNTGTGALPFSGENLFDSFVFDTLGVITLRTSLNYGNFLPSTLTKNILPFIEQKRSKLAASSLSRSKSQYRVWFNDGYGLWLTMVNQQYLGASIIYFPNPVSCTDDADTAASGIAGYFGSSDGLGYVYKLDAGTSFDGANIDAYITMAWDALKSPRMLKRFRAASIELQGDAYVEISLGYQLGYGTPNIGQSTNVNYGSDFASSPVWDVFTWDNFTWDGSALFPTDADVTGTAENIQVTLASSTNYIAAYTVNSLIYHFTPRRGIRV